jgi:hypothetical protein
MGVFRIVLPVYKVESGKLCLVGHSDFCLMFARPHAGIEEAFTDRLELGFAVIILTDSNKGAKASGRSAHVQVPMERGGDHQPQIIRRWSAIRPRYLACLVVAGQGPPAGGEEKSDLEKSQTRASIGKAPPRVK